MYNEAHPRHRFLSLLLVLSGSISLLSLAGCGTPGMPLPPSLLLPQAVSDLSATRNGDQLSLNWTMPLRTTDKMLLHEPIDVVVCRQAVAAAPCVKATELHLAPGAKGTWSEALPAELRAGSARALDYHVELRNRYGRSAGLSNAASVLAGQAPAPIHNLRLDLRREGVALHWDEPTPTAAVRLIRKRIEAKDASSHAAHKNSLAAPAEPLLQTLFIEPSDAARGRAIDSSVRKGELYEYQAQRITRVAISGQLLELAGELSAPVRISVEDRFAPPAPTLLEAVASLSDSGASIDLSWQPVADGNLAGYIVYRSLDGQTWTRLTVQPSIAPAYHDAQVESGASYQYCVTAISTNGMESPRSKSAHETVPTP